MTHKQIQDGIRVKAEGGYLEGYASTFDNVDRTGEIVLRGAFSDSVKAFTTGQAKIPLLDAHRVAGSTEAVVGRVVELKEDAIGLRFKAELSETALAQEIRKKVGEGLLDSLSIGYSIPVGGDEVRRDGVRLLKKLTLREISVVVFPANEAAKITGVKGQDATLAAKARLAQINRADADLRFIEERLADLDRKERMLETLEHFAARKEISDKEAGFII